MKKEFSRQEIYDAIFNTIESKVLSANPNMFPDEVEAIKVLNFRSIHADAERIVDILFDEI